MLLNLDDLTPAQLDALKEVGNIGAGHGATALSQMLGKKIRITVPRASILALGDVPHLVGDPQTLVAGLCLTILGDATGKIFLLFPGIPHCTWRICYLKRKWVPAKSLTKWGIRRSRKREISLQVPI